MAIFKGIIRGVSNHNDIASFYILITVSGEAGCKLGFARDPTVGGH